MPSNSAKSRSSVPSSRRQANTIPRTKPSPQAQSYVVLDVTLPSHIVNDRSLFMTYTPICKVHRTAFGNDITIEGIGDAHIRVFAAGQYILFRMRDCWHVPSSPHIFLSCPMITSNGYQVMIAARSPRILFSNKCRLAEPKLPKYIPLTKADGYFVLKFEIPIRGSVLPLSTTSKTAAQEAFSLNALAYQPFAGLSLAAHTKTSPSHSPLITISQPLNSTVPSLPLETGSPFAPDVLFSPLCFSSFSPFLNIQPSYYHLNSSPLPSSNSVQTLHPQAVILDSPSQPFISPHYPPCRDFSISPSSEGNWVQEPLVPPHELYQQTPFIRFPSLDPFNSHSPPFNQFLKAPISTIPYPVPPFNPQSIQLLQRQMPPTSNPLHPQTSPSISSNTFDTNNSPSPTVPASTNFSTLISSSSLQNPMSTSSCAGHAPAFTDSPTSIPQALRNHPPDLAFPLHLQIPTARPSPQSSLAGFPSSTLQASHNITSKLKSPIPSSLPSLSDSLEPEICSALTPSSNSTSFPLADTLPSLSYSEFFPSSLSSSDFTSLLPSNLPLNLFPCLAILSNLILILENPP